METRPGRTQTIRTRCPKCFKTMEYEDGTGLAPTCSHCGYIMTYAQMTVARIHHCSGCTLPEYLVASARRGSWDCAMTLRDQCVERGKWDHLISVMRRFVAERVGRAHVGPDEVWRLCKPEDVANAAVHVIPEGK